MIPIDQKTNRDCYQACFASILELKLGSVPVFPPDDNQLLRAESWLRERFGCTLLGIKPKEIYCIPAVWHIMCGKSVRGLVHAVVAFQGHVIHDPHPSKFGIKVATSYEFLIPLDMKVLFKLSVQDYHRLSDEIKSKFYVKDGRVHAN